MSPGLQREGLYFGLAAPSVFAEFDVDIYIYIYTGVHT